MNARRSITEKERQEIDICLSCPLPECIPDHPSCGLRDPRGSSRTHNGVPLCSQCLHAVIVETDNPLARSFYHCTALGYCTMGWRKQCTRYVGGRPRHYHPHSKRKEHVDAICRKPR